MTHKQRIEKVLKNIDKSIEVAKQTTVVLVYGGVKNRIFMEGEDKLGNSIGTYSESYKKVRQKKGMQTSFVDQTFSTNLKNSITYNKESIYFKNEYGKKVSGYNEQRFGKRIYAPSKDEANIFFTELNRELDKLWK